MMPKEWNMAGAPRARRGGKRFGLLGKTLGHSYSPLIHSQLGDYDYRLYEKGEEELAEFLARPDLGGLNVTIPYKQTVMSWCDALSPAASAIGCVNTLIFGEGPRGGTFIYGHNTDYDGFVYLARRTGVSFPGRKVLILGSGGTSLTAAYAARQLGAAQVVRVSRRGQDNYESLSRHRDAEIIVNTTPVGMFPHNEGRLIDLADFPACQGLLDVIYNPLRSNLVLAARERGIPAAGGLAMLVAQAVAAAGLFTGQAPKGEKTEEILAGLTASVENIALIGMPGCGKTRVGQALRELTGRPLLDTDEMVEKEAGRTIPRIFEEEGEAGFRARERAAVARAARERGAVIATGGGAALAEENRLALAQNSRIYFLERELGLLATAGRPLSKDLEALYARRLPVYQAAAGLAIANDRRPEDAAREILAAHQAAPRE